MQLKGGINVIQKIAKKILFNGVYDLGSHAFSYWFP